MRLRRHKDEAPEANERSEQDEPPEESDTRAEQLSATGTYLTDGRSLFRVQHAITEADGLDLEEPLLELEDCATLELILCSAGALERLGLRPVDPSANVRERERDASGTQDAQGLPSPPVRL
jgi:hypothetical protein